MNTMPSVVADIGGTNTRVAVCAGGVVDRASIRRFRNADHAGIAPILQTYLSDRGITPGAVCIDMAGPVANGVGRLTNLDWVIDAAALRAATGAARVAVLNDLQAQGMAVAGLGADGLETLIDAAAPKGPAPARLVVNVGTGLNAQPVLQAGARTIVPPAEAGHVSIPVETADDLRLRDFVAAHFTNGQRPGLEEVLSGRGLTRIDAWIRADAHTPRSPSDVLEAYTAAEPEAVAALKVFVRLLGRYTGDLALITQPVGGIYLVGGVIGHLRPHLADLGFAAAFRDKGRFAAFMAQFPVHVVTDDYAALTGCARHLAEAAG